MATSTRWDLPTRIIELSEADAWSGAVSEWKLQDVELLGPGESESCLCGHKPIRELCHIKNTKNGLTATVGNHCIAKFSGEELAEADFEVVPRIISGCRRIFSDANASANKELIEYAHRIGVFTERDRDFYVQVWRKRKRSDAQEGYKRSLNQKLLYEIVLSTKSAYQRLKTNPQGATAGPKLISYAFEKGVLAERDRDFYLQVWDRANSKLTERQLSWKRGLNSRIIQQLDGELHPNGQ